MIKTRFIWSFIIPILLPLVVFAYVNPGKPAGFVNDSAGVLKETERQQLETKLAAFEKNTGNEIAVVIIPDLGGDIIENFSVKLFEEWGIGEKGKDNGILILVARDDRKVRIEVGYGLEGSLTDAQSSWILKNIVVPAFRENNFYGGIDAAVDKIIAATQGEYVPGETSKSEGEQNFDWLFLLLFAPLWLASILGRSKSWWLGGVLGGVAGIIIGLIKGFLYIGLLGIGILIPLGLLFDFLVSRAYGKAKMEGRRPPWWIGGGGFGGSGRSGFGGFGGGSSGGGGSSSSW
jgi:uncharacterized protein